MVSDKLYETLIAGGWVLIPIFMVGALAFYILFRTCDTIGADLFRKRMEPPLAWFRAALHKPQHLPKSFWLHPGISYHFLQKLLALQGKNRAFVTSAFDIEMSRIFQRMERGLFFVSVLATVAPLLGLYGTVNGMVATFKTITMYGNSNPVLLADGISEALLTTQSGLLIAFPVLLLRNLIDDRISFIQKQLHKLGLSAIAHLEHPHE
jgi:biopolymer transport protein ExbB